MSRIKCENIDNIPEGHKCEHPDYEYFRKQFVSVAECREGNGRCTVSVYTVPPGKSAYPYHSHTENEEVFYIISGSGLLRTPDGGKEVTSGDLHYFPAGAENAHKLTNTSDTEALVYIDFDATAALDVALYPDSGKIGIWGRGINKVFRTDDNTGYYDGE